MVKIFHFPSLKHQNWQQTPSEKEWKSWRKSLLIFNVSRKVDNSTFTVDGSVKMFSRCEIELLSHSEERLKVFPYEKKEEEEEKYLNFPKKVHQQFEQLPDRHSELTFVLFLAFCSNWENSRNSRILLQAGGSRVWSWVRRGELEKCGKRNCKSISVD